MKTKNIKKKHFSDNYIHNNHDIYIIVLVDCNEARKITQWFTVFLNTEQSIFEKSIDVCFEKIHVYISLNTRVTVSAHFKTS